MNYLNQMLLLQAVHVAAQYGQTAFLNHIVAKYHADFDAPDNDGRSPLHWYVRWFYASICHMDSPFLDSPADIPAMFRFHDGLFLDDTHLACSFSHRCGGAL